SARPAIRTGRSAWLLRAAGEPRGASARRTGGRNRQVAPSLRGMPRASQLGFFEQLESRVARLPGVQAAGTGNCPPLSGECNGTIIWFRDRPEVTRGAEPSV